MKLFQQFFRVIWPDTSHCSRGQLWIRKKPLWRHGFDTLDLVEIDCISNDGIAITSCPPCRAEKWCPPIKSPGPTLYLCELVKEYRQIQTAEAAELGFLI